MSAARRIKRNARRYHLEEQLRQADIAKTVVIFGSGRGDGTLVHPVVVGGTLFGLVVPPEGASQEVLRAYSARATAATTGECRLCGARRHVRAGSHVTRVRFFHEPDCPVTDENLRALVAAERGAA